LLHGGLTLFFLNAAGLGSCVINRSKQHKNMSDSDEEQDIENELLACLEEEEEETVPHQNTGAMSSNKWDRFIHLGEDLTTRICMVGTCENDHQLCKQIPSHTH
jgi:hypothetical protein